MKALAKGTSQMSVDDILEIIDSATEPKAMPKTEALDFIERIYMELQGRMEALRNEIMDEE